MVHYFGPHRRPLQLKIRMADTWTPGKGSQASGKKQVCPRQRCRGTSTCGSASAGGSGCSAHAGSDKPDRQQERVPVPALPLWSNSASAMRPADFPGGIFLTALVEKKHSQPHQPQNYPLFFFTALIITYHYIFFLF